MADELARRALRIFEEAIDLRDGERAAFLDEACRGCATVRAEVDALLATFEEETRAGTEHTSRFRLREADGSRFECGELLAQRYLIERVLGTGGMGEVYKAKDTRLDRYVAVKVLNLSNQDSSELRDRFEQEIKSVAGLSHPNIVTLYDTATCSGTEFAVMELIDGRTLRAEIGSGLEWRTASRFALGIAKALDAAHSLGVIHRDIKPDNVMIDSNGSVKVLDFGLAKPVDHSNDQGITTGAATPGTVPYMSPEQTNGLALDGATDIFSLGTTLFEMLSGTNPFRADTAFATMQNINAKSPQISTTVTGLPDKMATLIDEMLLRSAEYRPSAAEVARQLGLLLDLDAEIRPSAMVAQDEPSLPNAASDTKGSESTTTQGGRPSIAVLPLQSFSGDPNHRFLGDAIAQEVIIELARLHWLFVIARGSSFQFRDPNVRITEVGRVLGAKYVLTGTVEMLGSQGAVSVELLRTRDQQVVWAERFPVTMEDLLQLRYRITSNIVVSIESRIQISEVESAQRLGTENLDAWGAYHRGLWHMFRFNRDDNATAAKMFDHAVDLDPHFARAHAGLSFTHFQEAFLRFSEDERLHQQQAQAFAEKSLELDPLDPFTNLTMGRAAWLANDLDGAGSWFDRSLELSPNYAFAWYNQSLTNALRNDGEQAEDGAIRAMSLSPIDPMSYAMRGSLALSYVVRGDYEQAVPWVVKALNEPTAHVHLWLIAALVHQLAGREEAAARYAAGVFKRCPNYSQDQFFRVFPFQDPETLELCKQALVELGI